MSESRIIDSLLLTMEEERTINELLIHSFNHTDTSLDYVNKKNNKYIVVLVEDGQIIACAFLIYHTIDVIQNIVNTYLEINNLAIHSDYRGRGLCKVLMKHILSSKIHDKKVSSYYIKLSVVTDSSKPNTPGIKCYQKMRFKFIPTMNIFRSKDGYLSYMIRDPKRKQTKRRKKKTKKKK
jgi:N-acetylglutamate synthase-like GNAT family acetyltransferase